MRRSVVGRLILKDWQLNLPLMLLTLAGGGIALAIVLVGGETATVVGAVWFFVALIIFGCFLPSSNIVNEKKKQTQPFLMSLPISPIQYATAKLVSTVGMFVLPWLTLSLASVWLIAGRGVLPHGVIPATLILLTLTFLGFCMTTGTTLVGESEGWYIAATIVCNSSYGLVWYFMTRIPAVTHDLMNRVVVWNPTVLTMLGGEFGLIVLILALTLYLQSRKREFV
jgi:ABC-2 type transport system permease protein